jgi:hypothetical protein
MRIVRLRSVRLRSVRLPQVQSVCCSFHFSCAPAACCPAFPFPHQVRASASAEPSRGSASDLLILQPSAPTSVSVAVPSVTPITVFVVAFLVWAANKKKQKVTFKVTGRKHAARAATPCPRRQHHQQSAVLSQVLMMSVSTSSQNKQLLTVSVAVISMPG